VEFEARVTDIRLDSRVGAEHLWQIALDHTEFCAGAGGGVLIATAKSGAELQVPVERVEADAAGELWHFVRKPLVQGTVVVGRVACASPDGAGV
jgi:alanyl-tRNA synthetase